MKKLTVSLLCLSFVLMFACTEDETIEKHVYQQENLNFDTWSSGEEGDQELDRNSKD